MRKIFLCFFLFLVFAISYLFAEEDQYKIELNNIILNTESFDTLVKVTPIDFTAFEKLYKETNAMVDDFRRTYYAANKKRESYRIFQQGVEELSTSYNLLNQAKYSEEQYKESITLEQVSYAHKWKESAAEQQKKGYESIVRARNMFKKAAELLKNEKPTLE